ncbi:acyl carrier protein [Mycoplasma corogypsi]|uniref:acyl carrier protein n=1 Tax=Mycoplasma corogypsi TaxID=2106 RepID=UPI0038732EED
MNVKDYVFGELKKMTKKSFDEDSVISTLGVDSLDLAMLVTETESKFHITINDDEIASLLTINDIISLLTKLIE